MNYRPDFLKGKLDILTLNNCQSSKVKTFSSHGGLFINAHER